MIPKRNNSHTYLPHTHIREIEDLIEKKPQTNQSFKTLVDMDKAVGRDGAAANKVQKRKSLNSGFVFGNNNSRVTVGSEGGSDSDRGQVENIQKPKFEKFMSARFQQQQQRQQQQQQAPPSQPQKSSSTGQLPYAINKPKPRLPPRNPNSNANSNRSDLMREKMSLCFEKQPKRRNSFTINRQSSLKDLEGNGTNLEANGFENRMTVDKGSMVICRKMNNEANSLGRDTKGLRQSLPAARIYGEFINKRNNENQKNAQNVNYYPRQMNQMDNITYVGVSSPRAYQTVLPRDINENYQGVQFGCNARIGHPRQNQPSSISQLQNKLAIYEDEWLTKFPIEDCRQQIDIQKINQNQQKESSVTIPALREEFKKVLRGDQHSVVKKDYFPKVIQSNSSKQDSFKHQFSNVTISKSEVFQQCSKQPIGGFIIDESANKDETNRNKAYPSPANDQKMHIGSMISSQSSCGEMPNRVTFAYAQGNSMQYSLTIEGMSDEMVGKLVRGIRTILSQLE